MRGRITNEAGDEDLVWILGWGNRLHHENVQWLEDRFAEGGYRIHTIQIPDFPADFYDEWVRPAREYVADLDDFRLAGHSTGGLIASYLDGAETTTYLSPWWGYPEDMPGRVLDLVGRLGSRRKLIPSGISTREAIGALATDRQLADGAEKVSPRFVRETRRGHRERPSIDEDAVVFCTLRDQVVSTRAIGEAVPEEQVVLYDGGHELFSSERRDAYVEELLAAVDGGLAAVETA
ncbi:alpha/beta fold hydrolase [Haloarchaeobius amylolyticus]|uniref:alpha/beta fold hydrolase n=1 Tax=Haloarchaeobius amylolyticus TaxID=1198296 RepID=UPI0022714440|nr:alpha/beta fold hydrolase [Haloarchaeobius amylolyticus]